MRVRRPATVRSAAQHRAVDARARVGGDATRSAGRRASASTPSSVSRHQRRRQPVLGPDRDLDVERRPCPSMPSTMRDERRRRVEPDVVVPVVGVQRHEVGEQRPRRSACGTRSAATIVSSTYSRRDLGAARAGGSTSSHPAHRGCGRRTPAESKRGQARPVDRAGAAHQRAALAVPEQRVVGDRRRRRRRPSPMDPRAASWPDPSESGPRSPGVPGPTGRRARW